MTTHTHLYAYVDESGQDTLGALFVVSVVVCANERERLLLALEEIEKHSGKNNRKWQKARPQSREAYIRGLLASEHTVGTLFYEEFTESTQYLEMTSYATAKAIMRKSNDTPYRVTVYIDGLSRTDVVKVGKELRALNIQRRKVAGVRRDENNALIRLADALCGLVRDAREGIPGATDLLKQLKKKKIVSSL